MIREVFLLHLRSLNALPAAERWYWGVHSPQAVRKLGPWLTRYESYRALPPPRGAEAVGTGNYRMSELWFRDDEVVPDSQDLITYPGYEIDRGLAAPEAPPGPAYPPGDEGRAPVQLRVPAIPESTFLGAQARLDEQTVFRWVFAVRYPEGWEDLGDHWFTSVHVPEVCARGGVYKFTSSRVLAPRAALDAYGNRGVVAAPWSRWCELWYPDADSWCTAVADHHDWTPPPWASSGDGPVLAPLAERVSMFLLERPDWILGDHRPFQ